MDTLPLRLNPGDDLRGALQAAFVVAGTRGRGARGGLGPGAH